MVFRRLEMFRNSRPHISPKVKRDVSIRVKSLCPNQSVGERVNVVWWII